MLPEPLYKRDGIYVFHGDCRELLPQLKAWSIDLVLTDPPYGLSGKHDEAEIVVERPGAPLYLKRQYGDWDLEWNPAFLLSEAGRILKPGGSLVAFMAHEWIPLYEDSPLRTRKFGVWVKSNSPPRVRPGYQHSTEFWIWQTKDGKPFTWNGGFTQSNAIITPNPHSTDGDLVHPNQKPLELMKGFVLRHSNPGDLIIDPYMGSGTTLVAAYHLGRRCIGIELDREYCDAAIARLQQSSMIADESLCVIGRVQPMLPSFSESIKKGGT